MALNTYQPFTSQPPLIYQKSRTSLKPRLVKIKKVWYCSDDYFEGEGRSPREAYLDWLNDKKGFKNGLHTRHRGSGHMARV